MQLKKHNSKTPPEGRPKWLRRGVALLAPVATLATGGVVASTAYAGGGGGSQNAGGWSGGGKNDQGQGERGNGGRPGVCATGAKGSRRNAAPRLCLSPVEPGLVCGQDGFVVFFRSVGQEDRRLSHFQSRLVQGQQYPGSSASEVFPADKQDRRVRSCGLDHSFTLVEVGYAGVPQQFPQGRNTRLRGSLLRVFDGPQLAEE